jgi:hypothetical protein
MRKLFVVLYRTVPVTHGKRERKISQTQIAKTDGGYCFETLKEYRYVVQTSSKKHRNSIVYPLPNMTFVPARVTKAVMHRT